MDLINNELTWTGVLRLIIDLNNAHISERIKQIDLGANPYIGTVSTLLLAQETSPEEHEFLNSIKKDILTGDDIAKYATMASRLMSKPQ